MAIKTYHNEKRFRVEAELVFYTSKRNPKDAVKALEKLEFEANKRLLTSPTEVIKIDIIRAEQLPF